MNENDKYLFLNLKIFMPKRSFEAICECWDYYIKVTVFLLHVV